MNTIVHKVLVCLFMISGLSVSQNLIENPGFEYDMTGWSELWTRDANVGNAEIITDIVHTGTKALHILHWGDRDFSFSPNSKIAVNPGDVYSFSAWVRCDSVSNYIELNIPIYDENYNALDWGYATNAIGNTNGSFYKYTARCIIPEGVSYIHTRFTGAGYCDFYLDDVEVVLTGSNESTELSLENSILNVKISLISLSVEMKDKRIDRLWKTTVGSQFQIQSVDTIADGYDVHVLNVEDYYPMTIRYSLESDALKIEMMADENTEMKSEILYPGAIESDSSQYYVVPRASGIILPVEKNYPWWNYYFSGWKSTFGFVGVTDLQSGYMLVSEPYDAYIVFPKGGNKNLVNPELWHETVKGTFGYTRTMYLVPIAYDGYNEMCDWYRVYAEKMGFIKTFDEKLIEQPHLERLRGAIDFWALRNFTDSTFFDSLYSFGITRGIFSLAGGWYIENKEFNAVPTINRLGFLSSRYDILTDVWPPTHPEYPWYRTEGYPEDVIVDYDGSLLAGWKSYINDSIPFQGYYTCSQTHPEYEREILTDEIREIPWSCRFIDVELAMDLRECYSDNHPNTRREDAQWRIEALKVVKEEFNLVTGSEETKEWAFPVVDFGEGTMSLQPHHNAGYDWATPIDPEVPYVEYNVNSMVRVPLQGLISHDVMIPTWYTGDGMSKIPYYWDDKDLLNILYASMPLVMPPDQNYWYHHRERFLTSMLLTSAVFYECGFEQMERHDFLTSDRALHKTTFLNGWSVVVNFDSTSRSVEGLSLPAKGFYATNGDAEIFRLAPDGKLQAGIHTSDKVFVHPYDVEQKILGVTTMVPVVFWLDKTETGTRVFMSYINDIEPIELDMNEFPFALGDFEVITIDTKEATEITSIDESRYHIDPIEGRRFYEIVSDLTNVKDKPVFVASTTMQIYPNPSNSMVTVCYSLPKQSDVSIRVYSVLGELISEEIFTRQNAGEHSYHIKGMQFSSGVYVCQLKTNSDIVTKKLILIK